jgi:hypothetical protein
MAGQIDQIVSVSIQASAQTPQIPNFGIPAVLCYHTHNSDYIRTYSSLSGMVSDGFTTTEPAYLLAQSMLSQNPTIKQFKIIRGSTAVQQTMTFKVTDTANGDTVGFSLTRADGTTVAVTHLNAGSQTATAIATALAATAVTGATLTSSTDTVTVTVTASGAVWFVSGIAGGTFTDTTVTTNPATDLNNALGVDSTWYGISGEHFDATNIQAIAVWAEANKRLHYYTTVDTNNTTGATGIGHTLNLAAYTYSFGVFSGTPGQYAGAAAMANEFVRDPGTYTMAFKTLSAVSVDNLTDTQVTNLKNNKLNYYMSVAGVNILREGVCASGLYVDLRRGIDALTAQIQINEYSMLVSVPKVSFDPAGIAMVGAELRSALGQFTATPNQQAALLRNDPGFKPTITLPNISTVSSTDRANRLLKNVAFTAYAQNAVQTVQIAGVVNF